MAPLWGLVALLTLLDLARPALGQDQVCNVVLQGIDTQDELNTNSGSLQVALDRQVVGDYVLVSRLKPSGVLNSDIVVNTRFDGVCDVTQFSSIVCYSGGTALGAAAARPRTTGINSVGSPVIHQFTVAFPDHQRCFGPGVATIFTCLYVAGAFTVQDGAFVGFTNPTEFQVGYWRYGQQPIYRLDITAGSSSAGTATITFNGVECAASLAGVNDEASDAFTIVDDCVRTVEDTGQIWSNDEDVYFLGLDTSPLSLKPFLFDAGTTGAVAAWTQVTEPIFPDQTWVGQSSFNGDDVSWLNVTKMNTFSISYAQAGAIRGSEA